MFCSSIKPCVCGRVRVKSTLFRVYTTLLISTNTHVFVLWDCNFCPRFVFLVLIYYVFQHILSSLHALQILDHLQVYHESWAMIILICPPFDIYSLKYILLQERQTFMGQTYVHTSFWRSPVEKVRPEKHQGLCLPQVIYQWIDYYLTSENFLVLRQSVVEVRASIFPKLWEQTL